MSKPSTDLPGDRSPSIAVDAAHPWPGLSTFTEAQAAFFFGREAESRELVRRIERKTLTVLFGQSGLGKSSLLQAGAFPKLRELRYCPIYVRIDYGPEAPAPIEQIKATVRNATSLVGTWSQAGIAAAGESLWEFFHHRDDVLTNGRGERLVPLLVFDQFEEVFTLGSAGDDARAKARVLIEQLADLVENRPPADFEVRLDAGTLDAGQYDFERSDYRVLLSLREDYLPHLESLKTAMPSLMLNRLRLTRLAGTAALDAVMKPAPAMVNADVAREIVAFVSGRADVTTAEVEPALLSLVCRELNHRRIAAGTKVIDAALLEGSRDTILSEFYERTLADQPAAVRDFVEDELLTDSGYRENIALERAQRFLGHQAAALDVLVSRRLLRVEERLDVRRIELTHDVLCGVVKASRDTRRQREAAAAEQRRQVEAAAQLAAANATAAKARQQAVRARAIAAGCAVLAVAALGSAVYGYVSQRRARQAEQQAEQNAAEARDAQQLAIATRVEAERILAFLLQDVASEYRSSGDIKPALLLFDEILSYYEKLPAAAHTPESRANQAIAFVRASGVNWVAGDTKRSAELRSRAEQALAQIPASAPPQLRAEVETELLLDQSEAADVAADYVNQANYARQAIARIEPYGQRPDAPERLRFLLARAEERAGYSLGRVGSPESLVHYDASIRIQGELLAAGFRPDRTRMSYGYTLAWSSYGASNARLDGEAIERSRRALEILEGLEVKDPGNPILLGSLSIAQSSALRSMLRQGRASDALEIIPKYLAVSRQSVLLNPDSQTPGNNYLVAQHNTGRARLMGGDVEGALTEFSSNPEIAVGLRKGTVFQRLNLMVHHAVRAELEASGAGRWSDPSADQQVLIEVGQELMAEAGADSLGRTRTEAALGSHRQNLALARGDYAEAADLARRSLAVVAAVDTTESAARQVRFNTERNAHRSLGIAAVEAGRWAEADAAFGAALTAELSGASDARPEGFSLFLLTNHEARQAEFQAWQALAQSHLPDKAELAKQTGAEARRRLRALYDGTDRSSQLLGVAVALSEIAWSRAQLAGESAPSGDVRASLAEAERILTTCSPAFRETTWVKRIAAKLNEVKGLTR